MKRFSLSLILTLLCSSVHLFGQGVCDTIAFTWKGAIGNKYFFVETAQQDRSFTVYWGDGSSDSPTGEGISYPQMLVHDYGDFNTYNVTIVAHSSTCRFSYLDLVFKEVYSLDVSRATALTDLSCSRNQLTQLDVSNNLQLVNLLCFTNSLATLDVNVNTNLQILECDANMLDSLDVTNNSDLQKLECFNNKLTTLDVSRNPQLEVLYCELNSLTSLDVRSNTKLRDMRCYHNGLSSLDLRENKELTSLQCFENPLGSLDLSANKKLTSLLCYGNMLDALNVDSCPDLHVLNCHGNSIANMNLDRNTQLTNLYIFDNRVPLSAMYTLSQKNIAITDFGNQYLDTTSVDLDEWLVITPDSILNGSSRTVYRVTRNGIAATEGVNYHISGARIIFYKSGFYCVEMNNGAISTSPGDTAIAIRSFRAGPGPYLPELATLTISAGELLPGFDSGVLDYTVNMPCGNTSVLFSFTVATGNSITFSNGGTTYINSADTLILAAAAGTNRTLLVQVGSSEGVTIYTIQIVSPFSSDMLYKAFETTLEVVNNANVNGGYRFEPNGYEWYANGALLSGETRGVLYVSGGLVAGMSYSAQVTIVGNNGYKVKVCPVTMPAAVRSLSVYPNPNNTGLLTVKTNKEVNTPIEVFSIGGELLSTFAASGAITGIDISRMASGTYVVRANGEGAIVVKK